MSVVIKIMGNLSKKNKVIIVVGGMGLLLLGAICNDMITRLVKLDEQSSTVKTSTKCADASVYISEEDRNIYTYCLKSVEINEKGKYIELRDYYKEHDDAIEELIKNMENVETYKDGGSKLYVNERNDLAILECKTLDGNNDIYIGPKDMIYEEGFCENRYAAINTNEFEIAYTVSDIISHNDERYKYVTLYEPNGIEVETVLVEADLLKDVKRNKTYNFKFTSNYIPFESDIKSVFENAKLTEIVKIINN